MFKFLILSLIIISNGYSNLLEVYRLNGIKAVELILEKELESREYWDIYLKNKDLKYGYYESIDSIIYCQKDIKSITLYKKIGNKFISYFSNNVYIGKNNGDKEREGDLKTPIGSYDLTRKLVDIDKFYGPLALVTSYPNIYDKTKKKNGHGIWIHGLPQEKNRDKYTKGCIALDNKSIVSLESEININKSILLISQIKLFDVERSDISIILSDIYKWKNRWKSSDLNGYISFYSPKFKKQNGMDLKRFKKYKKIIFTKKGRKEIEFKNINISPYPNCDNKRLYKIVMDEKYSSKRHKFIGKKELYVEIVDGKLSILIEG